MAEQDWRQTMMEVERLRHQDLMSAFEKTSVAIAANSEQIAANSHQIGVLSESITRLEHKVDRIADATEQQLEIARIQAASINNLISHITAKN